ncbi:MAG: hypothetical protein VX278_18535 [Myxococcota bacterium]|nr:hypothetical protein [Myxococcota bacterium]
MGQTLLGINWDDSRSIGIQDVFGIEYRLEAQALDSRQIQLNGYPLEVTDSGNLPPLQGYAVTKWVILRAVFPFCIAMFLAAPRLCWTWYYAFWYRV